MNAAQFLRNLIGIVPYKIHTILTDNGVQFTNLPHQKYALPHIDAYNFAKRLKTLKGLTPYEFIITSWKNDPSCFKINPSLHNLGSYTYTWHCLKRVDAL